MKTIPTTLVLSLLVLLLPGATRSADVAFMAVFKNQSFEQENPFFASLRDSQHGDTNRQPVKFGVFIAASGSTSISAATFTPPVGGIIPVPSDNGDGSRNFENGFQYRPALDAAFPDGDYTINITGTTDGTRSVTVNLSGNAYPSTPFVSNWIEAQSVNAASGITLHWPALVGGDANDVIMVEVRQNTGQGDNTVAESPGPGAPGQLTGLSTSFAIAGGVLSPGVEYEVLLRFIKRVSADTSYTSALAGYMKETHLPLKTLGGTDTSAPNLESIRPPYGTSNVKDISSVVFRFSEPMDKSVNPAQAITWTGATPSGYLWSEDGRELFSRFSPTLPLNTSVTWTLNPDGSAAKLGDPAGVKLRNNVFGEFRTATGSDAASPDVARLFLIKAQDFTQTNATPVSLERYTAELEVELNGFGTVSNATISGTFGGPATLSGEDSDDGLSAELIYTSKSDLDAFFPSSSSYTNDIGAFRDGMRRIILDLPADAYPDTPTLLNFGALANANPADDLILTWSPMTTPAPDDFIMLEVRNAFGRTLFETPLPGAPGALSGSSTQVTIPAGSLPPGRSLQAEINFVKVVDKDTTSYGGVTAIAAFAKLTSFTITTSGQPIAPSIEALNYNAGMFQFRVRGEYRGTYSLQSSMVLSNFNYIFTGNTETPGTNGTGTFDFNAPNTGGQLIQFYRAFEGFPQNQGGPPPSQ